MISKYWLVIVKATNHLIENLHDWIGYFIERPKTEMIFDLNSVRQNGLIKIAVR
jgi:hypothetical protein